MELEDPKNRGMHYPEMEGVECRGIARGVRTEAHAHPEESDGIYFLLYTIFVGQKLWISGKF